MKLDAETLQAVGRDLRDQPEALIRWAVGLGGRSIATSSFGPFSAALLHMVTRVEPDMPIVWMDSGYGTPAMYHFVEEIRRRLNLNLKVYQPLRSRARREALDGPLPSIDDPRHKAFTEEVKLEPFERAIAELKPLVWITGIRAEETAERARMEPVLLNPNGVIKVAPLLGWTSKQLHEYLKRHELPNNFDYFDPTKVADHRECGLHIAH